MFAMIRNGALFTLGNVPVCKLNDTALPGLSR